MTQTLSLKQARRIALAAQGFADRPASGPIERRHLQRVLSRTGLIQIDSVSAVVRAHYMPLFSRLGAYPLSLIDDAANGRRRLLFEYWAHEASLLPVALWPLMQWRMERAADNRGIYGGLARFRGERAGFIEAVYKRVEAEGPLAASDLEGSKGQGGWWGWSQEKSALEWLFWAGRLTSRTRRGFERVYDLPERVLPPAVLGLPVPSVEEAHRALLTISARALGVATYGDLRDYFRLAPEDTKPRLSELVEAGELQPVEVKGWSQPGYLHRDARLPRKVFARALLAPFDPLVWERSRAERLFDFRYRIEIYTPAEKRQFGYYVLPFLLGEALVARVDLRADRPAGVLRVPAAFAEAGAPAHTAEELYAALTGMQAWLGLERMEIEGGGDLGPALAGLHASAPALTGRSPGA